MKVDKCPDENSSKHGALLTILVYMSENNQILERSIMLFHEDRRKIKGIEKHDYLAEAFQLLCWDTI